MVAPSRAALRNLAVALLAAGLVVLAAAMITPGGDTVRGAGPAIHPAAEITPNSLPRLNDEVAPAVSDAPQSQAGDHSGPDTAAVVADPVTVHPDLTPPDRAGDTSTRPAAPAPLGTVDGRAPPEPGSA